MEQKKFEVLYTYPPGPKTERGQGTVLHIVKNKLVYCTSNLVLIRNLDNFEESECYSQHREQVTCAKFSHNGNWVCSADVRGNIHIWDAIGKDHVARYVYDNYMPGLVKDLCWTSDNQRIIAVGEGKEIYAKAFLVDSGSKVGDLTMNGKQLLTCDVRGPRPFRLALAGEDFNTNWYEGPPYKWKKTEKYHTSFVNCLRFSPDGKYFITVSSDKKIVLYDGKEGTMIKEFKDCHTGGIWYCDWISDNNFATSSGDKTVKIWEVVEGEQIEIKLLNQLNTSEKPQISDQQVSVQNNKDQIISLSLGGQFNFFNNFKEQKLPDMIYEQHQNIISQLVFANNQLISGDKSGKILIWQDKQAVLPQGQGHTKEISSMVVSNDQKYLFSLCRKGEVKQLCLETQQFIKTISFDKLVVGLQYGFNNQLNILLENEIQILQDLEVVKKFPYANLSDPSCFTVDQQGDRVAIGNQKGKIIVLDINGAQKYEVSHLQSKITALKFSSKNLYSGDSSGKIMVWDKNTGEQITNRWSFHSQSVQKIEIGNKWIISCGLDNKIIIWDEETLEKVGDFANIHSQQLYTICLDIQQNQIYSSGSDWMIKKIQSPYNFQ